MLPSAALPSLPGDTPVTGMKAVSPVSDASNVLVQKKGLVEEISSRGSDSIVGVSSNQGGENQAVKPSWVKVAKKHVFSQQKFVVSEVDGKEKVVVPREVFEGAKPLWEDFVIGKFLNKKAPHVGKIHMIVNKIWRLGDRSSLIDVYEVNEFTVKFRIRNEGMRNRILNRGMWNIMDIPMIVSKWTPFAEEAQPAMKSIPLWITLTHVPTTLFTDKGLEFLASAVGKPKRLHPKTEACTSFDEAQILVEADLTKELPKEYTFTGEEDGEVESVIKYSYPWLPPRCSCCQKWGHLRDSCLSLKNKNTEEDSTPASPKGVETETVKKNQLLIHESVLTQETVVGSEKETRGAEVLGAVEENDKEEDEWITPSNVGRSPGKKTEGLKYGEVSILSNTFSVLEPEEEITEKKNEGELENREYPYAKSKYV